MEFGKLGSTNVAVGVVGFGTWRYSAGPAPIRAALDCGANFIDSAEAYGTEQVVGEAIRGRRQEVIVATKVSPRNFRRKDLVAAAEGSLRRLATDYIDLYQLHWPNYTVPIEETMSAMEDLVRSGKIRFIGLSNFSVRQLEQAQKSLSRERIVSNQLRYSLIERTIEQDILKYYRQNRITLIAFSPLGADFQKLHSADSQGVLSTVASRTGKTEAQIALNWVISQPGCIAIPKCSSKERAAENCAASGWRLSKEDYEMLTAKISYARRSPVEAALRRVVKHAFQLLGREL